MVYINFLMSAIIWKAVQTSTHNLSLSRTKKTYQFSFYSLENRTILHKRVNVFGMFEDVCIKVSSMLELQIIRMFT